MPLPRFVSAGEALTDMLRTGPNSWSSQVGGSTWNVARVAARLGMSSAFAGAVSKDVFGQELAAANAAAGLDGRFLQQLDRAPLLAMVHELNPPQYFFIGDDSADLHFDASRLPAAWLDELRWVHFGGISLAREPLASKLLALAREVKVKGVRISYDPNFRALMDKRYDATLRSMTALADVIKVSDEDLQGLFRCDDADAAFAALRAMNPGASYLYTRGAQGASLYQDGTVCHAPAPPVTVADTVGAGDASIGALIYSMMTYGERPPGEHLRFAVAAGAAACESAGASPPALDAVERLFQLTRTAASL
ncbi:carbohydrate kinase [Pseudoduganella sp. LjRoot289]|uniref:carbohydrate kinase family protein n=1 Tax=Pseudoduganella sp. LjRoot289 TaxID=3342314 RepID=UPI003ECE004D